MQCALIVNGKPEIRLPIESLLSFLVFGFLYYSKEIEDWFYVRACYFAKPLPLKELPSPLLFLTQPTLATTYYCMVWSQKKFFFSFPKPFTMSRFPGAMCSLPHFKTRWGRFGGGKRRKKRREKERKKRVLKHMIKSPPGC